MKIDYEHYTNTGKRMQLTYKRYTDLIDMAKNYDSATRFCNAQGWQDWMGDISGASMVLSALRDIYDIAHRGVKAMAGVTGNKLTEFCRQYGIPYRTAQEWSLNESKKMANYQQLLLGFAVITDKYI